MTDATGDPFNLKRFVDAQNEPDGAGAARSIYDSALDELRAGAKRGHWIWFVFPQLAGLGQSYRSEFYGLGGLEEAAAYHAHPVLGARLLDCVEAMLAHEEKSAAGILGALDAVKFKSSMTLFSRAVPQEPRFRQALAQFYWGAQDMGTLEKLGRA